MRLRLHIKFALWLLLAGIVPLAIMGGYSMVKVERTVQQNAGWAFLALGEETAKEVNRIVSDGINSVNFLAENLIVTSASSDIDQLEAELVKTQRFHPIIKDLTLLDLQGEIKASARYSFRGNWASTSWYRQAVEGKRVFTGVHAVLYPFDIVMTTAAPVIDPLSGEVSGVLVGQLNMGLIWRIFIDLHLGVEAKALLLDNHGNIIASPDHGELLSAVDPQIHRAMKKNQAGTGHIVRKGQEELMVYVPLPQNGADVTADWHVAFTQPVKFAYAATTSVWRGLMLAAAVSLIAVAIVSTILSRHINNRIGPLIRATRNLGKGEYPLHLDNLGQDEIGELGEAFTSTATALAKSNEEIRVYQETLEELVETRTQDLQETNEQLQQQIEERIRMEEERKQLEELFRQSQKMEAVGTLAGGIAHDFNNILQMISGQVQLLMMKKKQTDPEYTTLSEIDQTTSRASELVRRLLTFSRKMDTAPKRMNLNTMIQSTVKLLSRTMPKTVSIETHLASDLNDVLADYNQMEQVLMNLTSNGADAMADGGILEIVTENREVDAGNGKLLAIKPGRYVVLVVADTGTGMSEPVKKRIFEPFFTSKEIGKGTGLGLSTVYGIVQDHAGHIVCDSRPGLGTTFSMYLPVAAPAREEEYDEPLPLDDFQGLGGLETVLVVDDEAIVREIAEDMLSRFGYKIRLCQNGEEALDLYAEQQNDIDLIITDLGMPGMGGERFIQNLRQQDPGVRIIVASGYLSLSSETKASSLGVQAFIQKPYQLKKMLKTIRQVLDWN